MEAGLTFLLLLLASSHLCSALVVHLQTLMDQTGKLAFSFLSHIVQFDVV